MLSLASSIGQDDNDDPQAIIVWDNPNNSKPGVKTKMILEQFYNQAYFEVMQCRRSSVLLGGCNEEYNGWPNLDGVIGIISLTNGETEEMIREWL